MFNNPSRISRFLGRITGSLIGEGKANKAATQATIQASYNYVNQLNIARSIEIEPKPILKNIKHVIKESK